MRGFFRYLQYCVLLVVACHQPPAAVKDTTGDSTQKTSKPLPPVTLPLAKEDSAIVKTLKRRMEVIDDSVYYYQKVRRLHMDLYIFRRYPVKLVYSKYGSYYFDRKGEVFARQLFWSEENITGQFFLKYNTVIDFNTTIYTDNWKLHKLDVIEAMERKRACAAELDSLMGMFPRVSYSLP